MVYNNNITDAFKMRSHWFEHVRSTRKSLSKQRKEQVTHQDAMREASISWPSKKEKIQKKILREQKKVDKEKNK